MEGTKFLFYFLIATSCLSFICACPLFEFDCILVVFSNIVYAAGGVGLSGTGLLDDHLGWRLSRGVLIVVLASLVRMKKVS